MRFDSALKDYKRHILWLDYFNSTLSRAQGRRTPLNKSVKDPKLDELVEAVQRLGYKPEAESVKHPKRMWTLSGYVSVEKRAQLKKSHTLSDIAKELSSIRGEKAIASATQAKEQQKQSQKSKKR